MAGVRKKETEKPKFELEETDLRSITRHPDRMLCEVRIDLGWGPNGHEKRLRWLRAGECQVRRQSERSDDGRWRLEAHLANNACDAEHDTAWAFRLPLIGLQLGGLAVHYSQTHFVAYVDPSLDAFGVRSGDFAVPLPGYNPMTHPKATKCLGVYDEKKKLYCKWNEGEEHVIVPDGFYLPPFNAEMYRAVAGKKVEIVIGPELPKEEGDDED